jgi:putative ABC transport system permease protein
MSARSIRASWQVPMRMARRTAWRERGRASMVVLLIALPVAAVAGSSIAGSTDNVVALRAATASLGTADAAMRYDGTPATALSAFGEAPSAGTPAAATPAASVPSTAATRPLPLLPPGSRVIQRRSSSGSITYDGQPFLRVALREEDLADPLLRGSYQLVSGRLPATSGEVVVSAELAQRISLGKNADITITGQNPLANNTFRIVGIVEDAAHRDQTGTILAPLAALHLGGAGTTSDYLVQVPGGLSWSQVLALGTQGWRTLSRQVLARPPAGCTQQDAYCDRYGPQVTYASSGRVDTGAATVTALAIVMALLQIVLLVGPAFAVGLRRRRRDLGLLAVSGARPGQLRRVVLAEGVVLGVVGSALGLALAWAGVYLSRGTLERGGDDHWLGLPVVSPVVLVVAGFGLVTAVVAAVQPARQAGRTDAASAVGRGSLHLTTREGTRRIRVLGALAVVLGTAAVVVVGERRTGAGGFRAQSSLIVLMAGCIAAELGIVALTPSIVELVSRMAARVRLTPRLALRDAARNRLRSGAAVAAVTAAMAASVAALLYATSVAANADRGYQPRSPIGSVTVTFDGSAGPAVAEQVRAALAKVLPFRQSWAVLTAGDASDGTNTVDTVQVVTPPGNMCPADTLSQQGVTDQQRLDAAAKDPRCTPTRSPYQYSGLPGAPVGDADLLAALTGVDSATARHAIDTGGAVVFDPYSVSGGQVTIEVDRLSGAAQTSLRLRTVTAQSAVLKQGFVPSAVFLSPLLAKRLGVPPGPSLVYGTLAHPVSGSQIDAADAVVARVTGSTGSVSVEQGRPRSSTDLLLAVVVAVAALLAVAASITAGGLALADSRADLATLAAVGAPPRVRRRLAAAQAGVLTLVGCALGVGAGFLPGWSMVHSTDDGSGQRPVPLSLVVPWHWIGALTVGLPVVTALAVGLAVRSRIPLGRRTD